jgi:hypothetical protein
VRHLDVALGEIGSHSSRILQSPESGTRVEVVACGRGESPGCANFRQALASPYPGRKIHDLVATI